MRKLVSICMLLIFFSTLPLVANANTVTTKSFSVPTSGGNKSVTAVYINLNDPSIDVTSVLASGGIGTNESLKSMAERSNAIAAINGTFFNAYFNQYPHGAIFVNGEAKHLSEDMTSLYFDSGHLPKLDYLTYKIRGTRNGKSDWQHEWYAWNINHPVPNSSDAVVIYTPEFGQEIQPPYNTVITVENGVITGIGTGVTPIPANGFLICLGNGGTLEFMKNMFKIGDKVDYRVIPITSSNEEVIDLRTVINTGPTLTYGGKIALAPHKEGMTDPHVLETAAYRSMIGVTADNQLVFATINGATIAQLAEVAQNMGLIYSQNGDGGASAGLYANGRVVSAPGRLLSNAIVVKKYQEMNIVFRGERLDGLSGFIKEDKHTMVPFRAVMEKMGAKVYWDDKTSSAVAERNGVRIQLKPGSRDVVVAGKVHQLPTAPQVTAGVTYIPLRFMVESFGLDIYPDWSSNTVIIE